MEGILNSKWNATNFKIASERISLQHLDSSVGDISKLEQAVEVFKDTPGAKGDDGPIKRLMAEGASIHPGKLITARGSAFELEVAYNLSTKGQKIVSFGNKLPLRDITGNVIKKIDVDIESTTTFIECKNWDWSKITEKSIIRYAK